MIVSKVQKVKEVEDILKQYLKPFELLKPV